MLQMFSWKRIMSSRMFSQRATAVAWLSDLVVSTCESRCTKVNRWVYSLLSLLFSHALGEECKDRTCSSGIWHEPSCALGRKLNHNDGLHALFATCSTVLPTGSPSSNSTLHFSAQPPQTDRDKSSVFGILYYIYHRGFFLDALTRWDLECSVSGTKYQTRASTS
jgi:hypothetical protein